MDAVERWLGRAIGLVEIGVRSTALVAGALILALAFLISWTVLARKFGGPTPPAIDEIGGFAVAVASGFVMAWGLETKSHIRIDVVYRFFPAAWRGVLNAFAALLIAATAAFLASRMWAVVAVSAARGAMTPSELATPLAWPQSLWAAGFTLFAVYAGLVAASAAIDVARGRLGELALRLGPEAIRADDASVPGEGGPAASSRPGGRGAGD